MAAATDEALRACGMSRQKMRYARALAQDTGAPPVLLLDEVAAHLEPLRREALFDRLRQGTAQVWLTGTELAPFEGILSEAAIWRMRSTPMRTTLVPGVRASCA